MIHVDECDFKYYESLEEIKADKLSPIRVWSPVQFFTFAGRKTVLSKESLVPLDCQYVILAKTAEYERYYLRTFNTEHTIDAFFFCRKSLDFGGSLDSIETLHRYIFDDKVWLLMTEEMVADTKKMLERLVKAHVQGVAELKYKTYIQILEGVLKLEDYKDYGKSLVGFRTACRVQQEYIDRLWKSCLKN